MYKAPLRTTYRTLHKIPESLLYKVPQKYYGFNHEFFKMFSTKTGEIEGFIKLSKTNTTLREDYQGEILSIDFISSRKFNSGAGTKLINFAKNYSKLNGCGGYLTLNADNSFTPQRIPHLFYRKLGFSSFNDKIDKRLDRFIKKGKDATYRDFACLPMHYPAIKNEEKQTLANKLYAKIEEGLTRIKTLFNTSRR